VSHVDLPLQFWMSRARCCRIGSGNLRCENRRITATAEAHGQSSRKSEVDRTHCFIANLVEHFLPANLVDHFLRCPTISLADIHCARLECLPQSSCARCCQQDRYGGPRSKRASAKFWWTHSHRPNPEMPCFLSIFFDCLRRAWIRLSLVEEGFVVTCRLRRGTQRKRYRQRQRRRQVPTANRLFA